MQVLDELLPENLRHDVLTYVACSSVLSCDHLVDSLDPGAIRELLKRLELRLAAKGEVRGPTYAGCR